MVFVGKISSVRVQTDKATGKGKGFAFMEFPEAEAMQVHTAIGSDHYLRCHAYQGANLEMERVLFFLDLDFNILCSSF